VNVRMRTLVCAIGLLAFVAFSANRADAQGLTGQIGGTVVDSSDAAIPGATVVVENTVSHATRQTVTDATGSFVITNLLAGTYDLSVNLTGFRPYTQTGLVLSAQERIGLPPIALQVGGFEEALTVQAEALRVQTQSAERSGTVTAEQMDEIQVRGRDFLGTLKVLPGVVDTSSREVPGWGGLNIEVNGQTSLNLTFDGIVTKDTGGNFGTYAMPNMDSVAELRVQLSNFQAEYGRSSGSNINVITKSGNSTFRGGFGYYKRHEALNANTWNRRRDCAAGVEASCDKLPYRYDNYTWNLGGPVVWPGFNENRDMLFFFFSQEIAPRTVPPGGPTRRRMPTLLERNGDFSQTVDDNGQRVWIRDPLLPAANCNETSGGSACFTNNVIPANRLNPLGRQILSLLPEPNLAPTDDTGFNNYQHYNTQETLRRDSVGRVDWNVGPATTFYSRVQFGRQRSESMNNQLGSNSGWPQARTEYAINTWGMVNTLLHTFSAATVMELTFGWNKAFQDVNFVDGYETQNIRDNVGLGGLPVFYPEANIERYLPNISLGGGEIPGSIAGFALDNRFPFDAYNHIWNWSANLTHVRGTHNMKMGVFIERTARPAPRAASWNGTYNFGRNTLHPSDTNTGMSNVLLGVVNSYQESTKRPFAEGRFNQVEWFVQDNWRAVRNLTIDYGMRFVYSGPTYMEGQQGSHFVEGEWDSTQAALLYRPACSNGSNNCSGATRVAQDPLTGEQLSSTYIGRLVPNSGNFDNGMVVFDQTPWDAVFRVAPRFGFSWDVFGDGKTAVRGGFGTNYDRYGDDTILRMIEQPPVMITNEANLTTLENLLASPLTRTPPSVRGLLQVKPPTVHNWSLGVQQELPGRVIADIAYVGNIARNQGQNVQINDLAPGTLDLALNPSAEDPSRRGRTLPNDFLRPMQGFGRVQVQHWDGEEDYHSLQVSLNQRRGRFSWSAAYTNVISNYQLGTPQIYFTDAQNRARYRRNQGRPHLLVVNYAYDIPTPSTNDVVRAILGDWRVSGLSEFRGGSRSGFSLAWTGAPTGGPTYGQEGSRVNVVCDPSLPRSERTFERQFRTECIQAPSGGADDPFYLGTSTLDEWVGLGIVNHDLTLVKQIPMTGSRSLQFRIEAYNVFNSTQFEGVDTSARFSYATGEQLNPSFGRVTGVRGNSNRVVQLAVRFAF